MEQQKLYELTHRKLTGQITGAELLYFEELSKDADNKKLISEIEEVWAKTGETEDLVFDQKSAYEKFLNKTNQTFSDNSPNQPPKRVFKLWQLASAIAAIFVLSVFVVKQLETDILTHSFNEGATITLEDNSRITLSEGSQIHYPENFAKNRSLELQGKAVFEVAKNMGSQFSVMAGKTKITVLGTTFLVETDQADHTQNIEVIEGKVQVDNESNHIVISDRQGLEIQPDGTFSRKDNINFAGNNLYQPTLAYNNAPLTKVLADLEVTYNIVFSMPSGADFTNCKFTSKDLSGVPLEDIITILKTTYNAEFIQKENSNYEIKRLACR